MQSSVVLSNVDWSGLRGFNYVEVEMLAEKLLECTRADWSALEFDWREGYN